MRLRLVFLVLLASVGFSLALPNEILPEGNPLLAPVCLAPLFFVVLQIGSFRTACLLGMLFGAVSTALANYWLIFFKEYAFWTLGGVVLGYTGYNALLLPFLYGLANLPGARAEACRGHGWPRSGACTDAYAPGMPTSKRGHGCPSAWELRPILLACAWTVYEYLKSIGFLGYPWGLAAYLVHGILPLIQIVDLAGVWSLSFLASLVNAVAAEWLDCAWKPARLRSCISPTLFCICLASLFLVYGAFRLAVDIPLQGTADLLLVQSNEDPWKPRGVVAEARENLLLTRRGLREAGRKPALVVWSETALSRPLKGRESFFERNPQDIPMLPFIRSTGTYFLVGAPYVVDWKEGRAMNAALLIDPEGRVSDYYGKQHPVPFAESVPFWELEAVRGFFGKWVGLEDVWVIGSRSTIFEIRTDGFGVLRFAAPICFEDAFAGLCRGFVREGADLLVNITNVAWSKTVSAEIQHFVAARFRAVENRRSLARSTNGGLTAVVGPKGEILARAPLFREHALFCPVPIVDSRVKTPYTLLGDWLPLVLAAFLLLVLIRAAGRPGTGRVQPKLKE